MSEIISNLFGRRENDTADSPAEDTAASTAGTPSDAADADETVDTEAIETESTEPESTDTKVDEDAEETAETSADEDLAAEATDEDEDEDDAQVEEPVALEAEDAAVVAAVTESDEAEPAAAPARPAAATRGNVTVDDSVVAKVVTIVAAKIDGVYSLDAEGISVEVDGNVATIKVSLVIEFGHAVKALAEQVRIDVIEAVEQYLGYDVAAVDVHVSDIHLPTA